MNDTEKPKIMVIGIPCSGNRLMRHILFTAGARASVHHAPDSVRKGALHKPVGAVLMVRSQPFWDRSTERRQDRLRLANNYFPKARSSQFLGGHMLAATVSELAAQEIPFMVVTYEALIHYTKDVIEALCERWKLTWPEGVEPTIYDANTTPDEEKPRHNEEGGIFRSPIVP